MNPIVSVTTTNEEQATHYIKKFRNLFFEPFVYYKTPVLFCKNICIHVDGNVDISEHATEDMVVTIHWMPYLTDDEYKVARDYYKAFVSGNRPELAVPEEFLYMVDEGYFAPVKTTRPVIKFPETMYIDDLKRKRD